jgi:hypothetical protein
LGHPWDITNDDSSSGHAVQQVSPLDKPNQDDVDLWEEEIYQRVKEPRNVEPIVCFHACCNSNACDNWVSGGNSSDDVQERKDVRPGIFKNVVSPQITDSF